MHADAGYTGVEKRAEIVALGADRLTGRLRANAATIKALAEGAEKASASKPWEKAKAVRAGVCGTSLSHREESYFGHRKVRYRGLAKNGHQLYTLFGLANVVLGPAVNSDTASEQSTGLRQRPCTPCGVHP